MSGRLQQTPRTGAAGVPTFPCTAAADSLGAACDALVDELRAVGYDLPSVYLLVDGRLRCQAARGYFQVIDGFFPGVGVIGRCVRSGTPLVIEDAAADPGFLAAIPGLVAEACVPVRVQDAVVGAVNVESRTALPAEALDVLEAAAAVLADWLERHGGMPEVPLTQQLARISLELTSSTDPEHILRAAVHGAAVLSGMGSGVIARPVGDGSWRRTAAGPLAGRLRLWTDAAFATMASWVRAGTSSHFPGGEDPPAGYEFLVQAGARALTVHPLVAGGQQLGLLAAASARPLAIEPATGAALELLAAQTAAALRMSEAVAELRLQAVQDALTGLPNARAFSADLERAAAREPSGDPALVALFLIDLDHFKVTNDTYGHIAGDGLLRALAAEIGKELRPGDALYRIGGDEFAALITVHDATDIADVGTRIVQAARRVRTTVSVGAAAVDGGDGMAVRSFADIALYRAKAAGRDCLQVSGQD